jgi:protein-S-isoprenylcysteine O-methyltransferase Ste14
MEIFFRIALGIIYFSQVFLLLFFYRKTNDKKVLHDTANETPIFVAIRTSWVVLVICSILLHIFLPSLMEWSNVYLNTTLRSCGVIAGILSNLLIFWVVHTLGENISAALKVRDNQRLVANGPYRYVRHPLYVAGIPLFLSIFLISSNWFLGFIGVSFQLFIILVRTPIEEKMLLQHFGDEYQYYMNNTGAYFPKFKQK